MKFFARSRCACRGGEDVSQRGCLCLQRAHLMCVCVYPSHLDSTRVSFLIRVRSTASFMIARPFFRFAGHGGVCGCFKHVTAGPVLEIPLWHGVETLLLQIDKRENTPVAA